MNSQLPSMQRAELPDGTQSTTGRLCLLSRPLPPFPFPQKDQQKVAAKLRRPSHTSYLCPQVFSVACLNHQQQTFPTHPVPCAELAPRTAGIYREFGEWGKLYLCRFLKSPLIRCKSVPLIHKLDHQSQKRWSPHPQQSGLGAVLLKVLSPFLLCLRVNSCMCVHFCFNLFLSVYGGQKINLGVIS